MNIYTRGLSILVDYQRIPEAIPSKSNNPRSFCASPQALRGLLQLPWKMLQPGHWWIFHGKPWFWLLPKSPYGRISIHFCPFFPTNSGTNVTASSHLKVAKANTFFRKSASSRSVLIKALLAFPFLEIDQVDFLTRSETTFTSHQLRYIKSSFLFMTNTLWHCGYFFGATIAVPNISTSTPRPGRSPRAQ